MVKSISKQIKDETEEPLLDKSGESLKKLIIKGKKNGFLLRNECELALENEKFEDKDEVSKKSYFEITFATIVKISEEVKAKEEFEKILLCDVQIKIYPELEKSLLELLHNSGYPGIKFEKKVDFEKLYYQRFN